MRMWRHTQDLDDRNLDPIGDDDVYPGMLIQVIFDLISVLIGMRMCRLG